MRPRTARTLLLPFLALLTLLLALLAAPPSTAQDAVSQPT